MDLIRFALKSFMYSSPILQFALDALAQINALSKLCPKGAAPPVPFFYLLLPSPTYSNGQFSRSASHNKKTMRGEVKCK